jgi:hypothetical protein
LYSNCNNIQRDTGDIEWTDLARMVEKWRPQPSEAETLSASHDLSTYEAKLAELHNWKQNYVFE